MRIEVAGPLRYRGRNARPNWVALCISILIALGVGGVGALFSPATASTAAWYATLTKPDWTPPNGWFGPIWTVLYLAMASAAWLVWSERYHPRRRYAMSSYAAQLIVNALWAPTFFGARSLGGGLFLIITLWVALAWTVREFAKVRVAAAWALVPYLVWVSIAMALNLAIWRHNV